MEQPLLLQILGDIVMMNQTERIILSHGKTFGKRYGRDMGREKKRLRKKADA